MRPTSWPSSTSTNVGVALTGLRERDAGLLLVADMHAPQRRLPALGGMRIARADLGVPATAPAAGGIVEHQELGSLGAGNAGKQACEEHQGNQSELAGHAYPHASRAGARRLSSRTARALSGLPRPLLASKP